MSGDAWIVVQPPLYNTLSRLQAYMLAYRHSPDAGMAADYELKVQEMVEKLWDQLAPRDQEPPNLSPQTPANAR